MPHDPHGPNPPGAEQERLTTYDQILRDARRLAEHTHPQAPAQLHAAFANSVGYLTCGLAGGYGGPSVREHLVNRRYAGQRMTYEDATELLLAPDGPIFGPLTEEHHRVADVEHCFDDAPSDLQALRPSRPY